MARDGVALGEPMGEGLAGELNIDDFFAVFTEKMMVVFPILILVASDVVLQMDSHQISSFSTCSDYAVYSGKAQTTAKLAGFGLNLPRAQWAPRMVKHLFNRSLLPCRPFRQTSNPRIFRL